MRLQAVNYCELVVQDVFLVDRDDLREGIDAEVFEVIVLGFEKAGHRAGRLFEELLARVNARDGFDTLISDSIADVDARVVSPS